VRSLTFRSSIALLMLASPAAQAVDTRLALSTLRRMLRRTPNHSRQASRRSHLLGSAQIVPA